MTDAIARLGLESHVEGGFYRQTYESPAQVETPGGVRPLANSIYYLLTSESPIGHLHRNRSDIVHFHHWGGPVHYVLVSPSGAVKEVVLGRDYAAGESTELRRTRGLVEDFVPRGGQTGVPHQRGRRAGVPIR